MTCNVVHGSDCRAWLEQRECRPMEMPEWWPQEYPLVVVDDGDSHDLSVTEPRTGCCVGWIGRGSTDASWFASRSAKRVAEKIAAGVSEQVRRYPYLYPDEVNHAR